MATTASTVDESTAAPRGRGRLLQVLGVAFGVAVIIGNTIGSGILRTPGSVAALLPSQTLFLLAWLAGGAYALLGVVSLAELGVLIPRSGGQYVFARRAFGPYTGFVIGASDWISSTASFAAAAILISEYLAALFPSLLRFTVPVAVSVVVVFTVVQWRGVRWGDSVQQVTTLLKAARIHRADRRLLLPHPDVSTINDRRAGSRADCRRASPPWCSRCRP